MKDLIRIDREHLSDCCFWYEYNQPTLNGEKLVIELTLCTNPGGNNSIPHLWFKNGWTKKELETFWSIQTYATDSESNTYGSYNPTVKKARYKDFDSTKRKEVTKYRRETNFKWILEATEKNRIKLLNKIETDAFGTVAVDEIKKSELEEND